MGKDPIVEEELKRRTMRQDFFLTNLVSMANTLGFETALTLSVGGRTISGMLISGEKYFQLLSKSFLGAINDEETRKQFSDYFNVWIENYEPNKLKAEKTETGYIHLMGISFGDGSNLTKIDPPGVVWRGKLSSVDGFMIGSMYN